MRTVLAIRPLWVGRNWLAMDLFNTGVNFHMWLWSPGDSAIMACRTIFRSDARKRTSLFVTLQIASERFQVPFSVRLPQVEIELVI